MPNPRSPRFPAGSIPLIPLIIAFTLGCPTPSPAAAPSLRDRVQARLQAVADAAVKDGDYPGISLAASLPDGTILTAVAGVADRDTRVPLKPSDRMPAGSVGKTFVAAAALQLAKEGRLDLDAKVGHYLGEAPWFPRLPNAGDLTVRMLLNHTAGLERHEFKEAFTTALTRDPDRAWKPAELVAYVLDDRPLFPAGKGWAYSDTHYIVLGMVLEKITGTAWFGMLRERFLEPLRLKDTLPAESRVIPGLVQGYAGEANPFGGTDAMITNGRFAFNPRNEWTGGGVVSTPRDLARWARELYAGPLIDPALRAQMLEGVATDMGPGVTYGLGVLIRPSSRGITWGHSGFFPGYLTDMAYFPDLRVAVAVQANSSVPRRRGRALFPLLVEVAGALGSSGSSCRVP
ncbi:MAG: beta-lactamase family protein [Acidobacteria bacterium]|nr:beta-lactamase family protein [Acidobacteriota bacterium]